MDAQERLEKRRLPAAVGTDQKDALPTADVHIHMLEQLFVVKREGQVIHHQHVVAAALPDSKIKVDGFDLLVRPF